jgi:hypothetical protein
MEKANPRFLPQALLGSNIRAALEGVCTISDADWKN